MAKAARTTKRSNCRGVIDSVEAGGFVEGWTVDPTAPARVVEVALMAKGEIVARGFADRCRVDLVESNIGHGWHGFRLALPPALMAETALALTLVDVQTGSKIGNAKTLDPSAVAGQEAENTFVDGILPIDASVVRSIDQIAAIGPILDAFIHEHGIEEFVDRVYCYVLGRPSDPGGLASYAGILHRSELKPLGLIGILYDSDERRNSKWDMFGPSSRYFPFNVEVL
ncbi:MAG: hypothetical protein CFE31_09900 [Rhizobiales bacterium PAR1]|nr:MAG: hypothetical protein CFE31_09900 [Rhizobiales bacterium PAR1]